MSQDTRSTVSEYDRARVRIERRRKFGSDLMAYLVVNAFLIGIWAMSGFGYFWPIWVMAGWGVLLVLGAWDTFYRQDVTDDDIQREMRRRR